MVGIRRAGRRHYLPLHAGLAQRGRETGRRRHFEEGSGESPQVAACSQLMLLPCKPWSSAGRRTPAAIKTLSPTTSNGCKRRRSPPRRNVHRKGSWSYGDNALGNRAAVPGDGSNSQFALLALYEAARAAEKYHLHLDIKGENL